MLKQQTNKLTTIIDFYQCDNIASELNNSLFGQIKNIFEHDNTFVIVFVIVFVTVITMMLKQQTNKGLEPVVTKDNFPELEPVVTKDNFPELELVVTKDNFPELELVVTKDNFPELEPVVTKDNFPELLSLCLDFNGAFTYGDCGIVHKKVNIHVPTKYFIGATPIQPSDFFHYRTIQLHISLDGDGSSKLTCHIPSMSFNYGGGKECLHNIYIETVADIQGKNVLCDALQWYDTFFSNFYDRITISYSLKDNIFNIPVKRFINIRKKFDELFLKYIKQVYNKKVLKILKRNVIDQYINTDLSRSMYGAHQYVHKPDEFFINLFSKLGCRDESRYFNDFIIQNLTIDFFAESD